MSPHAGSLRSLIRKASVALLIVLGFGLHFAFVTDVAASAWGAQSSEAPEGYDPIPSSTTPPANSRTAALYGYVARSHPSRDRMRVSSGVLATKDGRALPRLAGGAPKPDEILRPGGNPIGRAGTSPGIREVSTREELEDLFEQVRIHGTPTSSRYPGTGIDLPDGGFAGLRQSRRFGPTLDINIPGVRDVKKIHVRP